MRKVKFVPAIVVVAFALSIGIGIVQAQGSEPKDQQLTPEQMANAIEVATPKDARSGGPGAIYRLASCDPKDQEAPCYFTVSGSSNATAEQQAYTVSPMSSSATLVCGINIYNGAGGLAAILKENVNVTFWNQYGKAPVTMNWGNLNGTWSQVTYNWWNLSGPNPSPGWGTYANTAYATASGTLVWGVPPFQGSQYYSVLLTINSNGWYCQ
jgi:hypothetical protein